MQVMITGVGGLIGSNLADWIIRNKPEVRKWMFTGHVISLKEHSAWVHSLKNDSSRITFAMLEFDEIIGAFNIYNINIMTFFFSNKFCYIF